jgi:hypothetical protein
MGLAGRLIFDRRNMNYMKENSFAFYSFIPVPYVPPVKMSCIKTQINLPLIQAPCRL